MFLLKIGLFDLKKLLKECLIKNFLEKLFLKEEGEERGAHPFPVLKGKKGNAMHDWVQIWIWSKVVYRCELKKLFYYDKKYVFFLNVSPGPLEKTINVSHNKKKFHLFELCHANECTVHDGLINSLNSQISLPQKIDLILFSQSEIK